MRYLQPLALTLALAATLSAQTPAPTGANAGNTISVDAKLVIVPAVVRDKKGAILNNLTQADFNLKVDTKPQTLRYFDHDTDVPFTIGLLVDTSRSQTSVLDAERSASAKFLENMLSPATATRASDKAFIVQFAASVELLQDVTDSRPKLQQGLKQLDTTSTSAPSFQPSADSSDNTGNSSHAHGGTTLYDAVFLSSDEVTAKYKGRRALILLTDGVDRNSKESITSSLEAAQRADTIIYAIYYKGEEHHDNSNYGNHGGHHGGGGYPGGGGGGYPGGGGGGYPGGGGGGYPNGGSQGGGNNHPTGADHTPFIDGRKVLERMCSETGGRVFDVTKKQTVDEIYAQIAEELHSQYRLGFTPTVDATKDGYHLVDLSLTNKDYKGSTVQTRDGYYTGK